MTESPARETRQPWPTAVPAVLTVKIYNIYVLAGLRLPRAGRGEGWEMEEHERDAFPRKHTDREAPIATLQMADQAAQCKH